MNFWQLCSDRPYLVFFSLWIVCWAIVEIVRALTGKKAESSDG